MRQTQHRLCVPTQGPSLVDITAEVQSAIASAGISIGIATVFVQHTSASLLIQENADPDVQRDLLAFFRRLVPPGDPLFAHTIEGPDDMPAHVKSALTQTSLSIPVASGRLLIGTWQAIYLFEHRDAAHRRNVVVHVLGE